MPVLTDTTTTVKKAEVEGGHEYPLDCELSMFYNNESGVLTTEVVLQECEDLKPGDTIRIVVTPGKEDDDGNGN